VPLRGSAMASPPSLSVNTSVAAPSRIVPSSVRSLPNLGPSSVHSTVPAAPSTGLARSNKGFFATTPQHSSTTSGSKGPPTPSRLPAMASPAHRAADAVGSPMRMGRGDAASEQFRLQSRALVDGSPNPNTKTRVVSKAPQAQAESPRAALERDVFHAAVGSPLATVGKALVSPSWKSSSGPARLDALPLAGSEIEDVLQELSACTCWSSRIRADRSRALHLLVGLLLAVCHLWSCACVCARLTDAVVVTAAAAFRGPVSDSDDDKAASDFNASASPASSWDGVSDSLSSSEEEYVVGDDTEVGLEWTVDRNSATLSRSASRRSLDRTMSRGRLSPTSPPMDTMMSGDDGAYTRRSRRSDPRCRVEVWTRFRSDPALSVPPPRDDDDVTVVPHTERGGHVLSVTVGVPMLARAQA
jgi:hypothetical protein